MSSGPAGPDIAIFLRNLAGGGIERVMLLLAGAFVQDGLAVELIVGERRGARADEVPTGVAVVELGPGSVAAGRLAALRADPSGLPTLAAPVLLARKVAPTLAFLPGLARRLHAHPPRALLAATPFENLEALRARRLTGGRFRVVLSEHNQIGRSLIDSREWSRRCLPALMRRAYPEAEAIVAVSNGVAGRSPVSRPCRGQGSRRSTTRS